MVDNIVIGCIILIYDPTTSLLLIMEDINEKCCFALLFFVYFVVFLLCNAKMVRS